MSGGSTKGRLPFGRQTALLLAVLLAAVVVVAMVAAVGEWGDQALAVPVTLAALLLVAHSLRSDQQSRRLHRRLTALETAAKKQRVQNGNVLRQVATTTRRTGVRVERLEESLSDAKSRGFLHEVRKLSRQSFDQVQATINLFDMIEVRAVIPPMRHWAVSPDALALLVQELIDERPKLVVECGSGISTLFLALAARQNDIDTRIVALDHEAEYAGKTNRLLARHGVSDVAEARHAPLVDVPGVDGVQQWYDPAALADLDGIGLLFVDGPPATTGPLARFPALPQTWDRLAPRASVVLDDMIRQDERNIVKLWRAAHPELEREHHRTEKGTTFLRRG